MNIDYIREFVVLAKLKSYTEAANELFISQSSLTRHIQSMEQYLQVPLFIRSTRTIALSEFGAVFLPYAQEIAQIQKEYTDAINIVLEKDPATLHLGYTATLSEFGLLSCLSRFQRQHPSYKIRMTEGLSNEITDMLYKGIFNYAFIWKPLEIPENIGILPVLEDEVVLVVPSEEKFEERISLKELQAQEFILNKLLFAKDPVINAHIQDKLPQFKVALTNIIGFRPSTQIDLVSNHLGYALTNKRTALSVANEHVRIVEIYPQISLSFCLMYNKVPNRNIAEQQFLRYAVKHMDNMDSNAS
ncbi:MAG: LysR family transcriptional regulator [Lachnospiraceae bacterium]|nr:LysR family transcriptional regulator [Lachnospiraceae bacterium]